MNVQIFFIWLDMKKAKRAEEKRPQIWAEVNFKCVPPQTGEDDDLVDVRDMRNKYWV